MRLAALLIALLASCGGTQAFVCTSDAECVDGSRLGTCEANGFCSFPDGTCPTGSRYGEHASGGLAGECVDDGATTGIASTTATLTDDSSPTDPTTMDPTGDPTSLTTSDPVTTVDPSTTSDSEPMCGNQIAEGTEDCDGDVFVDCVDLGWDGGALQCDASCKFDESGCTECGNAILEDGEQCDTADLAGATCMSNGFFAGEIACDQECVLDLSGCNDCGNGEIDEGELCDGDVPGGWQCNDIGLGPGQLQCADCDFAIDQCGGNVQCGIDPVESIGDCPAGCAECEGNICIISCIGSSACAGDDVVCPTGYNCYVLCDGSSACANTTIDCHDYFGCQVSCAGSSGCANLDVDCGLYGECQLDCEDGTNVCTGASLNCGTDLCTANCGVNVDSFPDVNCLGPCACNTCEGD